MITILIIFMVAILTGTKPSSRKLNDNLLMEVLYVYIIFLNLFYDEKDSKFEFETYLICNFC